MILTKYSRILKLHVGLIVGLHAVVLSYYFYFFYLLFGTILLASIIYWCAYEKYMLEEIAREQDLFMYDQDMYLYK